MLVKNAQTMSDIDDIRAEYLSRKSPLNEIKKGLKDLSDADKKIIGPLANKISQDLEAELKAKYDVLYKVELDKKLASDRIDVTLPGKFIPQGKIHPLQLAQFYRPHLRNPALHPGGRGP